MKISECVDKFEKCSREFWARHPLTPEAEVGYTPKYDFIMRGQDGRVLCFKSVLIATFIHSQATLQFPYNKNNPSVPNADIDLFLSLKEFGQKANIPELTEVLISFDPASVTFAQISRRMPEPTIYRNTSNNIASCYTVDELIAIAATFYKAVAIVPVKIGEYDVYLGILDANPSYIQQPI